MHVGPSGSSRLDFRTLRVANSISLDVLVESASAFVRYGASQFRTDLSRFPPGADVVGLNLANDPGSDAGTHLLGEFVVGRFDRGWDSAFGEGDDTTVPLLVLSNSSGEVGVWVDNTAAAKTALAYALLQDVASGNTAYFGSTFGPFPHLDVSVSVPQATGGGTYVFEYWDGTTWSPVPVMATDAESPHEQHADDVFSRVNHEHIRLGETPGWAERALNGLSAFWLRYRLTAPVSDVPFLRLTKIGTNHGGFNENGELEFFGSAEPARRILNTRQVQYPVAGSAPGSVNIAFSTGITLNYTQNRLVDGAVDAFGFVVNVPHGLDTSRPLELAIIWMQDNNSAAGNVQFLVRYTAGEEGDLFNGSLSDTPVSTIVVAPGQQYRMNITRIRFAAPSLLPDEELVFTVTRDARASNTANDDLAGSIAIIDFTLEGAFWR